MENENYAINFIKLSIITIIMLSTLDVNFIFAQATPTDYSPQQIPDSHSPATQPPSNPLDLNKPPRKIHRIGTAIPAPPNSISIKSTDAGAIHRRSPTSGCSNCGIIDFVNKIGQGPGLNAIASGVVAGTVAREVIRQTPLPHGNHPGTMGGIPGNYGGNVVHPDNPYHVGITMSDGKQAIIALPDASHLQQGDRIQLIDGVLVLDRQ
jgi:hypothetical protein